jgi:5-methylcytosine-specific restriction endonuclease McrA
MKYTQKKCDSLLTPIVKKLHPKCLLCSNETQVAHHFIKKSVSSNLRYNIDNLIPLCSACHFRLHFNDEGLWNGRIALIKGKEWLDNLEKNKKATLKCDCIYYEENYNRLNSILTNSELL